MRMMRDLILVRPLPDPRSEVLHVIHAEESAYGEVLAVGPGKTDAKGRLHPLLLKPGDKVRYGRFSFPEHEGCLIMQEADVAGVVP